MGTEEDYKELEKKSSELHLQIILAHHAWQDGEETGYHDQHQKVTSVEFDRLRRAAASARVLAKRITRLEEAQGSWS
jgi:hypothetical protein